MSSRTRFKQLRDVETTTLLETLFLPVYQAFFDENGDFTAKVDEKLRASRRNENPDQYIATGLGLGAVAGIVLWVVSTLVLYGVFTAGVIPPSVLSIGFDAANETLNTALRQLRVPIGVGIGGVVFGTTGFTTVFAWYISRVFYEASQRERKINLVLPDAMAFMYALSVGGMNQIEIIRAMAESETTYDELAYEFQAMLNETEYFGTDYRNAIRQQAIDTPSAEFSEFLTDFLSIIDSGGDIESFLQEQKERHIETVQRENDEYLDRLELVAQIYMALAITPVIAVLMTVLIGVITSTNELLLYNTVYLLTPALNIGFIVFVAVIKRDEPGDGRLPHPREDTGAVSGSDSDSTASDVLTTDVVESYTGTHDVFDRIKEKQKLHQLKQVLAAPQKLWVETPVYTLPVTIPVVIAGVAVAAMTGIAPSPILPASWVSDTTATTVIWFYFPVLTVITPIAVFHEIGKRSTVNITSELSDGLRKVASANDTGQTLQKAIRTVGENGRGQLAKEFEAIHEKSVYGVGLQQAFIEFNNKYETPRLARITKLVTESREATNNVSDVLLTAARVNETNERMAKDQRDRTRMQTVIIMMSFLILLAVTLLLNENLISLLSGVSQNASAGVSGINGELVSMFFFHTVTIQGAFAGAVTGYIKSSSVLDGLKFSIGLLLITLTTWVVIV